GFYIGKLKVHDLDDEFQSERISVLGEQVDFGYPCSSQQIPWFSLAFSTSTASVKSLVLNRFTSVK
ncbi:19701_t:CDS:2, partial [Funneliformis geosporum]